MTRRRFYAPPGAFAPDGTAVTLAQDEARHLHDVLRLRRGDEVFVFDGEGKEYSCVVEENNRSAAKLSLDREVAPARPESPLHLTLALALLKGEKFDLVVQKTTELGIARIIPVITKLADVRVRDAQEASRRTDRWQRIALEAAKQSGRSRVPEINLPLAFEALIDKSSARPEACNLMFAERDGQGLAEAVKQLPPRPQRVLALVGSEGGWSGEEMAQAHDADWSIITLGGRTLRAETAAITVTALLQHQFGDLV